jgi:hypothetical protein
VAVRRIRQIESGFGRALLAVGAFLLATLLVGIVLGLLNSNLIWGEANQYGRVPIPGKKVVHLPSGEVQVNVAAALPGRGNQTPELLLPPLTLTMSALHPGEEAPTVAEDLGSSTNANDNEVDTQRRTWKLEVPAAGSYLAKVSGDFTGYGVNAQIWFGREPAPLNGWMIWVVAALIVVVLGAIWVAVAWLARRRSKRRSEPPDERADAAGPHGAGAATARAIERSSELERLRDSGAISAASFEAERAKIEAELKREREGAT